MCGEIKNTLDTPNLSCQELYIDTPVGKIRVQAKGENIPGGYPGVYIDFCKKDGTCIPLACTEFDSHDKALCTDVFPDCDDAYVERFTHSGWEESDDD